MKNRIVEKILVFFIHIYFKEVDKKKIKQLAQNTANIRKKSVFDFQLTFDFLKIKMNRFSVAYSCEFQEFCYASLKKTLENIFKFILN